MASVNSLLVLSLISSSSSSLLSSSSSFQNSLRRRREQTRVRLRRLQQRRSRRKATLLSLALSVLVLSQLGPSPRTVWVKPRSMDWWNRVVLQTFNEQDWLENLRISRSTFQYLCDKLRSCIERQDTQFRRALCVEHRVAITLWCLATCCEYRTIAHLFGVARCTVCVIVHDTCKAIVDILLASYIRFPQGSELSEVVDGFKTNRGMNQCAGAIDGSHISVLPPALQHTDYYNRKGYYSILIQAVVDDNYLFRDICVGWPGSVHDARVFVNSSLYKKATLGEILNGGVVNVHGTNIPTFLIGDSAYPLSTWLMKPFSHNSNLTVAERSFNYHLSSARIVVENAFGRLKARWRRLSKRNDMDINNVPCIVTACCILHNMCEKRGDSFNELWLEQTDSYSQPPVSSSTAGTNCRTANTIRNALVQYYT